MAPDDYDVFSDLLSSGDFGALEEECEALPDTVPSPGSAQLVVEDVCQALFTSATWSVVAKVGDHVIGSSGDVDHAHSVPFIKRWTRQLIRQNKERLRRLGVDVPATYTSFGGPVTDLDGC